MRRALGMGLCAVLAGVCLTSTVLASSGSYDATYWTSDFGSNVGINIPGSEFRSNYDEANNGYIWDDVVFAGRNLEGSYTYDHMLGKYVVYWSQDGGATWDEAEFDNESDAKKYVDDKFIALVAGNGGAASSTGGATPEAPVQASGNLAIENVIAPPIKSRTLWNKDKQRGGRLKRPSTTVLDIDNRSLANQPGPMGATFDESASSALRYEHRWYDDSEAQYNKIGATLRGGLQWDRVTLDIMVPMDRVDYNEDWDFLDYTRAGIVITPRMYLLTQEEKPVDLYFGLNLWYMHTFMDEGDIDPDHAGIGPLLGIAKDFDKCSLAGGYIWQRGTNLDGDNEVTGDTDVDVHKLAMTVGIPIGDRWALNIGGIYTHTCDLPDALDENFMTLSVGGNYAVKDAWTIDFALKRDLFLKDSDNFEVQVGVVWTF